MKSCSKLVLSSGRWMPDRQLQLIPPHPLFKLPRYADNLHYVKLRGDIPYPSPPLPLDIALLCLFWLFNLKRVERVLNPYFLNFVTLFCMLCYIALIIISLTWYNQYVVLMAWNLGVNILYIVKQPYNVNLY